MLGKQITAGQLIELEQQLIMTSKVQCSIHVGIMSNIHRYEGGCFTLSSNITSLVLVLDVTRAQTRRRHEPTI